MEKLFDRSLLQLRRSRLAQGKEKTDFLLVAAAQRMAERIEVMTRSFPVALELGCHHGVGGSVLRETGKIGQLIQSDPVPELAAEAPSRLKLAADEEWLPFADHSLDAVFSLFSLTLVNDLPGSLIQIRRALKPDGLLLATMPGPSTLRELREALLEAGQQHGLSPRIAPLVEVRDAGGLLQRAGFALPVVDSETLTLTYGDPIKLLRELRAMGQSNVLLRQHKGLTTAHFWQQVISAYPTLPDGRYPLTVELITLTAWSPDASQPLPARRGSGQVSLAQVLSPPK